MSIYNKRQQEIAEKIDSKTIKTNWGNWTWHIKHIIRDIDTFEKLTGLSFSAKKKHQLKKTIQKFPLAITPYYLSLIETEDYQNDPIFRQSFPDPAELIIEKYDMPDPLHEEKDSPVEGITHRYPDRVLFLVSNICSMYCRFCTRKRKVGDVDCIPSKTTILKGIEYIKKTPAVRDVLLSGGDPLMLADHYLDWILTELRKIEHVEIVRIGTRMPTVLPYRITDELVKMLQKHQPLYVNVHFNHPREITASSREALRKLSDGGFPLNNQCVLLAGINDCERIMRKLFHKLLQNRVRPYYMYQCDLSEGLCHFRTPVGKGMGIIESLIGHTSGLAIPTYVIDAPAGGGKIPIMPNYILTFSTNKVILRNYKGIITTYKEPDAYKPIFCDRECDNCTLQLKIDDADEYRAYGIEKLLSDSDDAIALTPESEISHDGSETTADE